MQENRPPEGPLLSHVHASLVHVGDTSTPFACLGSFLRPWQPHIDYTRLFQSSVSHRSMVHLLLSLIPNLVYRPPSVASVQTDSSAHSSAALAACGVAPLVSAGVPDPRPGRQKSAGRHAGYSRAIR